MGLNQGAAADELQLALVIRNAHMYALFSVDKNNGEDICYQQDAIKSNWCFAGPSRIRAGKGFCYISLMIDRLGIS